MRSPVGFGFGESFEIALEQGPHLLVHFVDEPDSGEHGFSDAMSSSLNAIHRDRGVSATGS